MGQALAGGIGGWALVLVGYESAATVQSKEVLDGIYGAATIAPAIGFFIRGDHAMVCVPVG